nr:sigma-70 family RNA polymerase sigma factor [Lipingzhangella rawalii]
MEPTVRAQDFESATDPFRREITAHCYRMLGSVHEAEDLVQETYIRAWRAYDRFEGRSSVRTWLHRIATRTCLTALENRERRPLPTGLGGPTSTPEGQLESRTDVPWLEPAPDDKVGVADDTDPGTVVTSRESVRLALVAALQYLPPRQRAVLVLRDVLSFRAAEVAEILELSTAAVNSLLQRARAQLAEVTPAAEDTAEPDTAQQRALLDRYVTAFENYDIPALVDLFRADAVWEMPPFVTWVRGADAIGRLIDAQCPAERPGDLLLVPTAANGQPAFGVYERTGDGKHEPFQIQVLQLHGARVGHVATFFDTSLFSTFGLPPTPPHRA